MRTIFLFVCILFSSNSKADNDCIFCFDFNFGDLLPQVGEWPIEYVKIEKKDYLRNPKAVYCKRPIEMVDTIVLHHSETRSTVTPEKINEFHLGNSPQDPWLMIGYTYVINAPYSGERLPLPRVSEGRPLDIVGAHAGSQLSAFVPMDKVQSELWDKGKVICGVEGGEFKVDPKLIYDGKIKANVTTIGLVIIGNYAPLSSNNPNGYPVNRIRYPTLTALDLAARTSCQLQKKYPRMKSIKWHSVYNATDCPGTVKQRIDFIKKQARNYGCEFN